MPRGVRARERPHCWRWSAAARGPFERLVGADLRACPRGFGPLARRFGGGQLGPWLGRLVA
eukprot:6225512-Alexandrium_andersonii.AAC.1